MREKRCKGKESLTQLILLNKINFRMMFEAGIADEVDHVPCEKGGSSSLNVKITCLMRTVSYVSYCLNIRHALGIL